MLAAAAAAPCLGKGTLCERERENGLFLCSNVNNMKCKKLYRAPAGLKTRCICRDNFGKWISVPKKFHVLQMLMSEETRRWQYTVTVEIIDTGKEERGLTLILQDNVSLEKYINSKDVK